jgi:hypothetical protein
VKWWPPILYNEEADLAREDLLILCYERFVQGKIIVKKPRQVPQIPYLGFVYLENAQSSHPKFP